MSVQNMILGVLRNMPQFVLRRLAGAPLEIDGNVLDTNIQIVANMAAAEAGDPPESVAEWRAAAAAYDDDAHMTDFVCMTVRCCYYLKMLKLRYLIVINDAHYDFVGCGSTYFVVGDSHCGNSHQRQAWQQGHPSSRRRHCNDAPS